MPQTILPRRCAVRSLPIPSKRALLSCTVFTLVLVARLPAAVAVTVSWNVDTDGFWDVPANWSTGMVPQPGQDVVIDRPAANVTVTFRSGTIAVNSLTSAEHFAMTGGSLDLTATSSTTTMTMSAGTLGGAGNLSISGSLTWTGGTMTGTGATNANGGITLSGSSVALRAGRTLNNAGTATWSGTGGFNNDTNVTFNNLAGASVAINTTADFFNGTFNNAGTVTKTSGGGDGITRIVGTLNNSNTMTVSSGRLELDNGGAHTGSFTIAGGATLEFGGGTHTLSAPASIGGAGTMSFAAGTTNANGGSYNVTGMTECSSGTHTFIAAVAITSVGALDVSGGTLNFSSGELITVATYTQSAGTVTGSDNVSVTGTLSWMGGTMSGQGATNANGGLLLTNASSVFLRDTRTLNNAAVAAWTGAGSISNDTGAVFNNLPGATLNMQSPGDFFNGTLNNAGTLTKVSGGGDGVSRISATVNNTGSITVTSGALELDNGGMHTGAFTVADIATLEFGGGAHTMTAGSIIGMGRMRFAGGTTNFNAGTYNITGVTECTFGTHTFNAAANVVSVGALDISGGTLNFSSGEVIATAMYMQSAGTLTGSDTLDVSGVVMWSGGTIGGSGTLNANAGMQISNAGGVFVSGTRTINNGGVATWNGSGSINNETGAVFNNLSGSTFAIETNGDFFGGRLNNAGTLTKSSGGGDGLTRVSATVNNSGVFTVTSGSMELENGGTDTGAFMIADGATLEFGGGTHVINAGASISGAGRMRFAAGTTNFNAGTYNITGITQCTSGTHTLLAPATVSSVGALELSGCTLSLGSGESITVPTYTHESGTLTGSDSVNVTGMFTWSGGTMSGQGVTTASGGMQLTNPTGIFLRETRVLNNNGAAVWTGAGSFGNDTGAVFNNAIGATLAIQTIGDFFNGTFNNAGTLTKTSGGGDGLTVFSGPFTNSGTVEVLSGIIRFGSSYTQSAGVTRLNGGAVEKSAPLPLAIDGGTLTGIGPIAGNVKVGGTLAPGLPVGELSITGTYEQTAPGKLAVEVGGVTPVTQFDRLTISGNATLAGTVDVTLVSGFTPSDGNSFRVMTYANETGDFSALTGAVGFTRTVTSTFTDLNFNSGPSNTSTPTRSATRTSTGTAVPTPTPTTAPTITVGATSTVTVTRTDTATATRTGTATATRTVTATSVITSTPEGATPTPTATGTSTPTPSVGFTVTRTQIPLPVAPVAAGDFGSDGIIDLAAGSNVEPKVALLRNNGPATFSLVDDATLPGGSGGLADVVVADMNNDDNLDAVVSNPGGELVGVVLGNGQHQFSGDPKVVGVDAAPQRIAVGELTSDGNLDVVVTTDTNILLLRGVGDGSITVIGSITTSTKPADVIIGDFNGDGDNDLLAALPDRNLVALYAGNGDGGFATGPSVSGNHPSALVLGRFTGAATPDLAVANADSVSVYPPVAGGFASTPIVTMSIVASRLFAAEVTGDQFLDLIAVNLDTGVARALPGDGSGHFGNNPNFAVDVGVPLGGAAFADFNGDTAIDLVMTDPATQELIIALNRLPPLPCVGDCNGDHLVNISELITGVNIALDRAPVERCPAFDADENLRVAINELVTAVNNGLRGCGR